MIKTIYPYLVFDGKGQEAVKFYESALGATVAKVLTFGDLPGSPETSMPEDQKNRVLNAHLKVGNTNLMISDTFPGSEQNPYQIGSQAEIALIVESTEGAKEVFEKLLLGGKVEMPLQETFWSPCYGQVADQFGIKWQISTEIEE